MLIEGLEPGLHRAHTANTAAANARAGAHQVSILLERVAAPRWSRISIA